MWMIRGGYGVLIMFFVLATLVISRNFRQRLAAEESERQAKLEITAERRYRDLLEAAPDGILEVDSEGSIVLANPVVERLFGYSRQELLGRSVDQLVPEHLAARHATHRRQYQSSPVTRPMGSSLELYGRRKDGALFPVEISLSPLSSSSGIRISAIIRDVSERKGAEERVRAIQEEFTARLSAANRELETRNREIEQANRLKSEFLANMSHELRTPLHTVIGFSELLSEEAKGPLNNDQKRFVGHIHKDAHHLLELINDLLDLSKIEAGKLQLRFETLDLCDVVDDALSSIRPQGAAKSIGIETRLPGSMTVEGDRLRLRQILINLLSNAVKFTPEGGHVSVEGAPVGELAQVSVTDTGIGIPQNEQEFVFDKFHQADSNASGRHEGTGLGLTITRQLVQEHGGHIWLRSEPGKGSCFTFTIPLKRNSE
jgi:PAS domain S-box-containing protein